MQQDFCETLDSKTWQYMEPGYENRPLEYVYVMHAIVKIHCESRELRVLALSVIENSIRLSQRLTRDLNISTRKQSQLLT